MDCKLKKLHKNIPQGKERFTEEFVRCPLFMRQELGMGIPAILCSLCCLRVNQVLEQRMQLLMRGTISSEDENANPRVVVDNLPEHLKPYALAILQEKKEFSTAMRECTHCRQGINEPIRKYDGKPITMVGRDGLR